MSRGDQGIVDIDTIEFSITEENGAHKQDSLESLLANYDSQNAKGSGNQEMGSGHNELEIGDDLREVSLKKFLDDTRVGTSKGRAALYEAGAFARGNWVQSVTAPEPDLIRGMIDTPRPNGGEIDGRPESRRESSRFSRLARTGEQFFSNGR